MAREQTTNLQNGVTNSINSATSEMVVLDYTRVHQYINDFDTYVAGDWTITSVGAATQALTDVDGGALLITNAAADNDSCFFNKKGESFTFEASKRLWFKSRFKVSDATQSDVVIGLQITDTTPLAVSDGVYFLKADGVATANFIVGASSTLTTTSSVATLANNTFTEWSFYYNGVDKVEVWVDGAFVASSVTTNLPSTELTVSFGVQNGEAVAKTMTLDYILVVKER